jgi:hypothetical protein
MSAEARLQPNAFERLRSALKDTSWSYDFVAEYVAELSSQKGEEDIFHRLAFHSANFGGTAPASSIVSDCSELYEAMGPGDKIELRRWWHEKIRREAYNYHDLGTRLSWRYLV